MNTEPVVTTVYALSSGSYSDYRVDCLFATRELAEEAKAKTVGDNEYHDYEIGDMTLYDGALPDRVTVWQQVCTINDDGTWHDDTKGRPISEEGFPWELAWKNHVTPVCWRWVRAPMHKDKAGRLEVFGTDRERVGCVSSDRRAMILANIPTWRLRKEATG